MFRFGFLFILGFSCLFLCEGAVFPPSNKTIMTFIPGSTEKLVWSFTDDIKNATIRTWTFTPKGGSLMNLAIVIGNGDVQILITSFKFAVKKPASLVLENVKLTYGGKYGFSLSPGGSAEVVVYIAVKPNAKACSSPIIVNEGDNVSCTCQGQGGNPPADVTWYKDNRTIGEAGKEEKTLTLTNVTNEKDNGSYKCVAQSHPNEMFQDEVIVEVIVRSNYKPNKTKIEVPEEAYVGEKLVINCSSDGLPAPSFTITHNVTSNIVSNHSNYMKHKVDHSDAGLYVCIAKNLLGNDTDSGNLIVKEKRPSTKSTTQPTTQSIPGKTTVRTSDNGANGSTSGLSTGAIVGIGVTVPLLLVIVIIVVYCCCKKKEKDGKNRGNIDPIGCNHYQLDASPPVYAAVDKENGQGNTLYASLDTDAMKPKRESKKEPTDRAPQTEYASIDFVKTANAPKTDPV